MSEPTSSDGAGAAAPSARGTLEVVLSAACFSTIPIFTILATERGGSSLETVLFGRYLFAAIGLLIAGGAGAARRVSRGHLTKLLVLGGGGQAIIAWLALSALRYLPAATMVFLFYTFPAWIAIIAAVRRTEPITPRRLLALALAFAGIWTLVGSPWAGVLHPVGVLLTLGAALTYALYIPLIGRLQEDIGAIGASMYISIGAAVIFLAGGLALGRLTTIATPLAWTGTLGLAIVSTTLAFILFLNGLALLGPVRTAIISTAEPFFVAALGALVLGQPAGWTTVAGGALVAAAVVVIQERSRAREIV